MKHLWQLSAKDGSRAPRPMGWKLKNLHEWLYDHPPIALADEDFLGKVVAIRKAAFKNTATKIAEDDAKLGAGNWVVKYPFLRVLHAIIDNEDNKNPSSAVLTFLLDVCLLKTRRSWLLSGPRLLRHRTIQISIQQPRPCQTSTPILLYQRLFLMNLLLICQRQWRRRLN